MSVLTRLQSIWPLLTALTSGAMLAAAHLYFQRFLGLQPCPLCLDQRNWHWAVLGVSIAAFLVTRWKPAWLRPAAILIGLVLLGSAGMGAYHVAVEQGWVIAQCDVRNAAGQSLVFDVNAELQTPQCDVVAWSLFGVSMAGYNALISLLLALASFAVAFAPERRS